MYPFVLPGAYPLSTPGVQVDGYPPVRGLLALKSAAGNTLSDGTLGYPEMPGGLLNRKALPRSVLPAASPTSPTVHTGKGRPLGPALQGLRVDSRGCLLYASMGFWSPMWRVEECNTRGVQHEAWFITTAAHSRKLGGYSGDSDSNSSPTTSFQAIPSSLLARSLKRFL